MTGFSNPLVGGGGALVYPAIHSPNFSIPLQTGWAINKDGSAYFFNITASGTITASTFLGTDFIIDSAGAFFYNGTPAFGNLPVSWETRPGVTADPFGNALPVTTGGFVTRNPVSGQMTQLTSGVLNFFVGVADKGLIDFDPVATTNGLLRVAATGGDTGIYLGSASNTSDGTIIVVPSGDTSGATDLLNITEAVSQTSSVELTPGTFFLPNGSGLDLRKAGLRFVGAGPRSTIIQIQGGQSNFPALQVAGEGQDIGGFRIGYNAQQTSAQTLAACLQLGDDTVGNCFMSRFHDLELFQGAYGSVINPALTATAGFFSCQFDNISIRGWSISSIFWNSAAGTGASSCTGSELNNIYCNNNPAGTQQTSSTFGIDIRNFDEIVFNQLNLEHCTINSTDWFNFQQVGNCVVNSLHCEELTLAGSAGNSGIFAIGSDTNLIINGMGIFFATLNGTVWNPVARFFGTGSNVRITGYNEGTTNAVGGASSGIHQWGAFSGADCVLNVTEVVAEQLISQLSTGLPATGCYAYTQWPETFGSWQNLGAPVAGWTVTGRARYRLMPDGTVLADINDLVGPGAGPADGTVIFVAANGLPAGYAPAAATRARAGPGDAALEFETNGAIQVFGVNGVANPRLDGSFQVSVV